jgi:SAM-dependent methyltransferase
MSENIKLAEFLESLKDALNAGSFIKLTLANYKGAEPELKNIYIRPAEIKREIKLSFTYRYKTRDIVKNYSPEEGIAILSGQLDSGFQSGSLFSSTMDLVLQLQAQGWVLRKLQPSMSTSGGLSHDKQKDRKITTSGKQYLVDLKLTDNQGNVFQHAQDKYKQINQYIEILSPIIKSLPAGTIKQVADMGSGKGYLTFALYDYLKNGLEQNVEVTGVEYRQDLVDLCNHITKSSEFGGLRFQQGTIEAYNTERIDILIALHACDTATDDAIYKGIQAGAALIVTAPCCHKQIRKEIIKGKASNELDFLMEHGIFLERQAEMVTDGIRALVMAYFGYKTKVMQFTSDVHTPKNILIVGVKQEQSDADKAKLLEKIKQTKAYFGISYHHLERLAGL